MSLSMILVCVYLGIGACFAIGLRLLRDAMEERNAKRDGALFWETLITEALPFLALTLCWPLPFVIVCFSEK